MVEFLLLDLDDTILDFHKAERVSIGETLRTFGVDPTESVLACYHAINKWHWEQLEQGKITRERLLVSRFCVLFEELGMKADPDACSRHYMEQLASGHFFLPGAEAALESLQGKYRLFLVSNGTANVQRRRLESGNLYRFFEDVFISQEIGVEKPSKLFFDRCFAKIPGFDPARAMIVGDSLSSDMQGGRNAGIATCWVNPGKKLANETIDYIIEGIYQLPGLLACL